MNELIRGIMKSKTMQANGGLLGTLLYFWNDPALASLPDKAKYVIIAVLVLNMLLRKATKTSLEEKGVKAPDTRQMALMEERMRQVVEDVLAKEKNPTSPGDPDAPPTTEDAN